MLDTTPKVETIAPRCLTPSAFVASPYFAKGLALMREVRTKVPVWLESRTARRGDGQLATVAYAAGSRREQIGGRNAAAPSGRRAQRQSRDGGRRSSIAGTTGSCAGRRCSIPTATASVEGIAIAGDGAGIGGRGNRAARGVSRRGLRSRRWRPRRIAKLALIGKFRARWPRPGAAGLSSTRCSAPPRSSAAPPATRSSAAARR